MTVHQGDLVSEIDQESPQTKFIAEISSNHNQDLGRSLALVEAAAEAGFDAVKFQLFEIDKLFAPEILAVSRVHQKRKKWELPRSFVPQLADKSRAPALMMSPRKNSTNTSQRSTTGPGKCLNRPGFSSVFYTRMELCQDSIRKSSENAPSAW